MYCGQRHWPPPTLRSSISGRALASSHLLSKNIFVISTKYICYFHKNILCVNRIYFHKKINHISGACLSVLPLVVKKYICYFHQNISFLEIEYISTQLKYISEALVVKKYSCYFHKKYIFCWYWIYFHTIYISVARLSFLPLVVQNIFVISTKIYILLKLNIFPHNSNIFPGRALASSHLLSKNIFVISTKYICYFHQKYIFCGNWIYFHTTQKYISVARLSFLPLVVQNIFVISTKIYILLKLNIFPHNSNIYLGRALASSHLLSKNIFVPQDIWFTLKYIFCVLQVAILEAQLIFVTFSCCEYSFSRVMQKGLLCVEFSQRILTIPEIAH